MGAACSGIGSGMAISCWAFSQIGGRGEGAAGCLSGAWTFISGWLSMNIEQIVVDDGAAHALGLAPGRVQEE